MFSDVLQSIKTRADIDIFIEDIDILLSGKYQLRPAPAKLLLNYKGDLLELRKKLLNLPEVRLTLAFEPDEKTIGEISDWCRREVDSSAMVRVEVDPSVLGGAKVSFGGKYGDFTVKKKFDAYEKF